MAQEWPGETMSIATIKKQISTNIKNSNVLGTVIATGITAMLLSQLSNNMDIVKAAAPSNADIALYQKLENFNDINLIYITGATILVLLTTLVFQQVVYKKIRSNVSGSILRFAAPFVLVIVCLLGIGSVSEIFNTYNYTKEAQRAIAYMEQAHAENLGEIPVDTEADTITAGSPKGTYENYRTSILSGYLPPEMYENNSIMRDYITK